MRAIWTYPTLDGREVTIERRMEGEDFMRPDGAVAMFDLSHQWYLCRFAEGDTFDGMPVYAKADELTLIIEPDLIPIEHDWVPGCGVDDCRDCEMVCASCGSGQ